MKRWSAIIVLALTAGALACSPSRRSGSGLRLPDGDPDRGREAFLAMKCNACHEVDALELPGPWADPPVPVRLGGEVLRLPTDGELVTSIVNPSHRLSRSRALELVRTGSRSRMGEYGDELTVRRLIDLVAFLQSRYRLVSPPSIT